MTRIRALGRCPILAANRGIAEKSRERSMTGRRAVVIGGSLAGLCAGRVLSDHFDSVVVIDRDAYPAEPEDRAGVPQGRHVHALLARGRREFNRLFPAFDERMLAGGALEVDFPWEFAVLRPYGWAERERSGIPTFFASRGLLEWVIRGLFRELPNVELVERTDVTRLLGTESGEKRVTGIEARSRDGGATTKIEADLVVDASGRSTKAPKWFGDLGVEPPEESVVDPFAGYSTRWYQAPDPWPTDWWWKGVWIDIKEPEYLTAGVMFPTEQNRFLITIASAARNYPPKDEAGFDAKLEELRSPLLAKAAAISKPLSTVYSNRSMANRFRHYERSKETLAGFLAIGDSVCGFNPVYGQGMSVAATCAGVLERSLRRLGPTSDDLPRIFFRSQARFLQQPWALATGVDLSIPETEGDRPLAGRLVGPYMRALGESSRESYFLRQRFGEVLNLIRPASSLFTPAVVGRVAYHSTRRWLSPRTRGEGAPPMPPPA
jgi:2-polyprenyl-6-methoxyphenol hydroxylase-like FAD-dependent oxidoreductase